MLWVRHSFMILAEDPFFAWYGHCRERLRVEDRCKGLMEKALAVSHGRGVSLKVANGRQHFRQKNVRLSAHWWVDFQSFPRCRETKHVLRVVGVIRGEYYLDQAREFEASTSSSNNVTLKVLANGLETLSSDLNQREVHRTISEECESEVFDAAKGSDVPVITRRRFVASGLGVLCIFLGQLQTSPRPVLAEEEAKKEEGGGFVDGVLSPFDPDEVTKSGRKLPKKYVKSVKEVVKCLRESFSQDAKDDAKFRRNADSAKEAIREYLQNWRGAKVVDTEDSYLALERAFRELGRFYASKGPRAALPDDIRTRVLEDLNKADDSL